MALVKRSVDLLQLYRKTVGDTVKDSPKEPSWIPDTSLSPTFMQSTYVKAPKNRVPANRCLWILKTNTEGWATIIGNRSFNEGVHYWEWTFINTPASPGLMFGLKEPSAEHARSTVQNDLWTHMGHPSRNGLYYDTLAWNIQPTLFNYQQNGSRGPQIDLGTTNYVNCRMGLLLDLVKCELTFFFFNSTNLTQTPDKTVVLCTLTKGKSYYPAFSLSTVALNLELTIDGIPPTTVKEYVEQINTLCDLLQSMKAELLNMERMNQQGEQRYHDLLITIANLSKRLNK